MPEAAAARPAGLTLIPGWSCPAARTGTACTCWRYLFDPEHTELSAQCAGDPAEPGPAAPGRWCARLVALGVPVTWEQVAEIAGGGVVGRPHVARAMVQAGVIGSVRGGVHAGVDRRRRPGARRPGTRSTRPGDPRWSASRGRQRAGAPAGGPAAAGRPAGRADRRAGGRRADRPGGRAPRSRRGRPGQALRGAGGVSWAWS